MLITPSDNPYNYTFDPIIAKIKDHLNNHTLAKACRLLKFKLVWADCINPINNISYKRCYFFNKNFNLIIKKNIRSKKLPDFSFIIPTFEVNSIIIQPFGDIMSRADREKIACNFQKELAGFDCHADNFVIFRGLPALIDW